MEKNQMKNKSPYEPRPLPGKEYEPQGYEPRVIKPEEFKNSDLAHQIYKKQRAYYDNN